MSLELDQENKNNLTPSQVRRIRALMKKKEELKQYGGHLNKYFPSSGPLAYYNYPKHMAFFAAGKAFSQRLFLAGNRVGKTVAGGYEVACHATGDYPEWWPGRRFDHPVDCWVVGDTGQTTRDIVQKELMGQPGDFGSGMIAKANIVNWTARPGISGAVDILQVRHKSGGISKIGFKSNDQGRRSFNGTAKHVIWGDEELDYDVWEECYLRTMTTQGIMISTMTPLKGLTEFIENYMKDAVNETDLEAAVNE